jgi:hypothetical protein
VTSDQNPEYDLVRRAVILADNPYHANSYDVKQMALRILQYEKNAQQNAQRIDSYRVRAGQMYSKG